MKNKNLKAFSFVELLVAVMLATSLMIGVSIFITNGIKNITDQKKVIDNINDQVDFFSILQNSINRISGEIGISYSSGVLFELSPEYDSAGFAYLGVKTLSGKVCNDEDSDFNQTKHLYLKNFIPFEEVGEDIFSGDDIFKGEESSYISDSLNHQILNSGTKIVGKEIFGDKYEKNTSGLENYLNSPTGITFGDNKLFISDTLNNRILYYSPTTGNIYKLLDENDGINFPTGLDYDNGVLYISNTGNGEILEYSGKDRDMNLNLDFKLDKDINNLKSLSIEFLTGVTDISNPDNISDFSFSNINTYTDYFTGSTNKIEYYFSNFGDTENVDGPKSISSCISGSSYFFEGGNIKRNRTDCDSTSTGTIYKEVSSSYQDLNSGTDITINLNNISGTDFSVNKNYYVKLSLVGDSTWEEYFPFYTNGDDKLGESSMGDNTLRIVKSGLKYPTGIIYNSGNLEFNDFLDRKIYIIDLDGNDISDSNLNDFDFDNLIENKQSEYLLDVPIKKLTYSVDNDVLTIVLDYYKKYDCVEEGNRVVRTMIFKKYIK